MTGIQRGSWTIQSVLVNSSPVSDADGFRQLVIKDKALAIEPAGIEFSVAQSTTRTAVLESRSQVFFADFCSSNGELTLKLTRPAFNEQISLNAKFNA
jgi:hypothetical protein